MKWEFQLQGRGCFPVYAPYMQAKRNRRRREKRKATNELTNGSWDVPPRCDAETAHFEEKSKVDEDEVVVQLEPSQSSVSVRQHPVVVFHRLCKCSIAMFMQGASMNENATNSVADCDVESNENVYAGESSQNEVINCA